MIDLHTHSLLSDGELLPSELARRAQERGYHVIGITDHADASNIELVISGILKACGEINKYWKIRAVPGIELTHMPLQSIREAVRFARAKGAKLVLVHGETISEPVIPGTNREAILSAADILTHPGLISLKDARLAAKRGVYLEITARPHHAFTNGHVANMAKLTGAGLVINSDAHSSKDLISRELAKKVLQGAGLDRKGIQAAFKNSEILVCKALDTGKII